MLAKVLGHWHNNLTDHKIEAGSVANKLNPVNSMPSEIDEWKEASSIKNLTDVVLVNNIKHHQDYFVSYDDFTWIFAREFGVH